MSCQIRQIDIFILFFFNHYFYFYRKKYLYACLIAYRSNMADRIYSSLSHDSISCRTNTHADTRTLSASGGLRRDNVLFTSDVRRRPQRLQQHPGCSTKMQMKDQLATADIKVIKILSSFFLSSFRSRVTLKAFPRIPGRTADDKGNLRIAELRYKLTSECVRDGKM